MLRLLLLKHIDGVRVSGYPKLVLSTYMRTTGAGTVQVVESLMCSSPWLVGAEPVGSTEIRELFEGGFHYFCFFFYSLVLFFLNLNSVSHPSFLPPFFFLFFSLFLPHFSFSPPFYIFLCVCVVGRGGGRVRERSVLKQGLGGAIGSIAADKNSGPCQIGETATGHERARWPCSRHTHIRTYMHTCVHT